MKLLIDQGVARSAATELRAAGLDAVHTAEQGLATATDAQLIDHARAEGRVVVTLDADFHTLLAVANATSPSVIRLRIQGLRGREVATIVQQVIELCKADLEAGAMVSVEASNVRVRRLPIVP